MFTFIEVVGTSLTASPSTQTMKSVKCVLCPLDTLGQLRHQRRSQGSSTVTSTSDLPACHRSVDQRQSRMEFTPEKDEVPCSRKTLYRKNLRQGGGCFKDNESPCVCGRSKVIGSSTRKKYKSVP